MLLGMEDPKAGLYKFEFSDSGRELLMLLKVSKDARTADGLLDGYNHCQPGSMWYNMMELALKDSHGGLAPGTPRGDEEWKIFKRVHLPFPVDKTFYETGVSELVPKNPQVMTLQPDGGFLKLSCFLKKKYIDTSKKAVNGFDGRSSKAKAMMAKYGLAPPNNNPNNSNNMNPCKSCRVDGC